MVYRKLKFQVDFSSLFIPLLFFRLFLTRPFRSSPGPYLGKFDWGGGCVPCGCRPQRGEVCGRGMCPLLHKDKARKLKLYFYSGGGAVAPPAPPPLNTALQSIVCFCSCRRLIASLLARFALVRRQNCFCSYSRQFRFSPSIVSALLVD